MRTITFLRWLFVIAVCAEAQATVISGTVTKNFALMPHVTVTIGGGQLTTPRVTTTDRNGVFSFEDIQPGCYTVTADVGDKPWSRKVTASGAAKEVDLPFIEPPAHRFRPGAFEGVTNDGTIYGTVTANGNVVCDVVTVVILPDSGFPISVDTRIDGGYEKSALIPGPYKVTAGSDTEKVDLKPGHRTPVNLDIEKKR